MIRTEERRVRIQTPTGIPVEGVVRVRRFSVGRDRRRVAFERHEPVAVIVRRAAGEERIEVPASGSGRLLAFVAVPIAARLAARMLTHRSLRRV